MDTRRLIAVMKKYYGNLGALFLARVMKRMGVNKENIMNYREGLIDNLIREVFSRTFSPNRCMVIRTELESALGIENNDYEWVD